MSVVTKRIPVATLSCGGEGEPLVTPGAAHGPLPATPGRGGLVRGEQHPRAARATTPLAEPAATTPTTPAPAAVLAIIAAACRGEGNEAVRWARGGPV